MNDIGGLEGAGTPRGRAGWSRAFKTVLTLALLYLIFTRVPLGTVLLSIRSADMKWFALACLAGIVSASFAAMRTKRLTDRQGMSLSAGMLFEISLATSFYGLFLPGFLSGGVLRWYRISRHDRNAIGAVAVVVLNRFLQTTAMAASGVIFFTLAGSARAHIAAGATLAAILAGLLATLAILVNERISVRIEGWVENRGRIPEAIRGRIRKLLRAFRRYRGMPLRDVARIAACLLVEEGIGAASYFMVARSVGIAVPFTDLGLVRSCVGILTTIPLSIGGFGIREGTLIVLLAPYGVAARMAVAFSLLTFARGLVYAALGGILEAKNAFFPAGRKPLSTRGGGDDA